MEVVWPPSWRPYGLYRGGERLRHLPIFYQLNQILALFHAMQLRTVCTLLFPARQLFSSHRSPSILLSFVAKKKRYPCTARRRAVVCARGSAPAPTGQGERQECQRVSKKNRTLGERSGKECDLKYPAHHQRAARPALVPAIVTDRPRRKDAAR